MRSIWAIRPTAPDPTQIHPALNSFADACRSMLVHLAAYVGVLALLVIIGAHLWGELPDSAGLEPAAKAGAVKAVIEAASTRSLDHGMALTLLAMLGDLDDAFAQAQLYEPLAPTTPPYLFLPTTAAMRSDPRFMPLARKFGFVAYWRATGHWPDFCSEPGLPYDCRAEAAKVAAQLRSP